MSRLVMFACLLMMATAVVCLDLPMGGKPPGEPPKDGLTHTLPGHLPHPDTSRQDIPRADLPRLDGEKPKEDKADAKAHQETKS